MEQKDFFEAYREAMMKIEPDQEFIERMKREIPLKAEAMKAAAESEQEAQVEEGEQDDRTHRSGPNAVEFAAAKRFGGKPWKIAVAACLVLAVGLGIVTLSPAVNNFFSGDEDIVIIDGIAHAEEGRQGMPITFRLTGYGYDNEPYTTNITEASVSFNFMFSCQGTEGDYVVYRFEGGSVVIMTEEDYSSAEDFVWKKEIQLTPGEVVEAHIQVSIPPHLEALERELLWEGTSEDYAEIINSGITELNDTVLVVECYKDGTVVKSSSFSLDADTKTYDELTNEVNGGNIPVTLTALT